jgi:hypothetical protein
VTRRPAPRAAVKPSSGPPSRPNVLGLPYSYDVAARETNAADVPGTPQFKEDIIQAFYDGIKHKRDTTFGDVKANSSRTKDPHFHRGNFCSIIRWSHWHA